MMQGGCSTLVRGWGNPALTFLFVLAIKSTQNQATRKIPPKIPLPNTLLDCQTLQFI